MNDQNVMAHEIGWDDAIENDSGSFVILEEGDYNFTVTGFERGRFPGGKKVPPCNKATLTLAVETAGGTATVQYDLLLWSTLEWKISEFFRAIGQKKHGEKLVPKWGQVIGAHGRGHFKPRTYTKKDGSEGTANDVEKFYDYDPKFFQADTPAWVNEAEQAQPVPMTAGGQPAWQTGKF